MITAWKETTLDFPAGPMTVVAATDGDAVVGIHFGPAAADPSWLGGSPAEPDHPLLVEASDQLHAYAAGRRETFDLPLRPAGTAFQLAVWSALREIPYGQTSTYGKVAAAVGRPASARAVGGAIGANPIGIVVPCHRVIGANGALTGFGGGLANKTALLSREGVLAV